MVPVLEELPKWAVLRETLQVRTLCADSGDVHTFSALDTFWRLYMSASMPPLVHYLCMLSQITHFGQC